VEIFIGTGGVPISCKSKSTVEGVKCIHELGLNAMEVEFVRGVKMNNTAAKEVGETAKELGVKLSVQHHTTSTFVLMTKKR